MRAAFHRQEDYFRVFSFPSFPLEIATPDRIPFGEINRVLGNGRVDIARVAKRGFFPS